MQGPDEGGARSTSDSGGAGDALLNHHAASFAPHPPPSPERAMLLAMPAATTSSAGGWAVWQEWAVEGRRAVLSATLGSPPTHPPALAFARAGLGLGGSLGYPPFALLLPLAGGWGWGARDICTMDALKQAILGAEPAEIKDIIATANFVPRWVAGGRGGGRGAAPTRLSRVLLWRARPTAPHGAPTPPCLPPLALAAGRRPSRASSSW